MGLQSISQNHGIVSSPTSMFLGATREEHELRNELGIEPGTEDATLPSAHSCHLGLYVIGVLYVVCDFMWML